MEDYIGKTYNYKGTNIEIQKVKNVSGNTVVMTDKRSFNLLPSEVESFISELKPKKEKTKVVPKIMAEIINEPKEVIKQEDNLDIKSILFDTINKVREDANYVKQANAICNITTQLINIKKLEKN